MALMQKPTVDIPRTSKAVSTQMGLGWMLDTYQAEKNEIGGRHFKKGFKILIDEVEPFDFFIEKK